MIRIFFGSPGCGKTTLACKFLKKYQRKYDHCFGAFSHKVPGAAVCSLDKLGEWTFLEHSYVNDDEAGIDFNSRRTLKVPQSMIQYLKLHRHYMVDMDFFSQAWDDIDVVLRRLCVQYWYMYKIGPWTLCRRVYKRVTIDTNTHQIIDGYHMPNLLWILAFPLQWLKLTDQRYMLTFRPFYYKYFDSWERPELPIKEFEKNEA